MFAVNEQELVRYLDAFKRLVELESGEGLTSFTGNPFLNNEEEYKAELYKKVRFEICNKDWNLDAIGSGKISDHMRNAIQKSRNLIHYHQVTHIKNILMEKMEAAERTLYDIYYGNDEKAAFEAAKECFGAKYDLLGYLFYLKDETRFLPIRPTKFDKVFSMLDIEFRAAYQCSWENYQNFIRIIKDVRERMESHFGFDIRLIDAHSFLWILQRFGEDIKEIDFDDLENRKDTQAVVKRRIGQMEFRAGVKDLWNDACAVTKCTQTDLLIASHIKPWRDCDADNEWRNPYNGLLLTPNLNAAFDKGYISFEDTGKIRISKLLSKENCKKLGISPDMMLRKVESKTKPFLEYHRMNVYKDKA